MRSLPVSSNCRPFRALSLFATLIAGAAALTSCGPKMGGGGGRGGFQMPPMPVEVADVHPQRVRHQFHALGNIQADESIAVTSEVSGVVRALPFAEGQWVAGNALLARLDDREAKAAADRAEAEREQAESNARRAVKLAEQQVISASELESIQAALKVAKANEAEAATRLEKTRIRAPWGGLTGRRRVSPGAYVEPGNVITEVARVDEVKVTFSAPERFATELKPGIAVELVTPAYPGQVFSGRVTVVDPLVDEQTRSVQMVARVPNPDRKLKPGMSADVSVTLAERPAALVVPDEAVFAEGAQNFVFVVKRDSTVARAPVQTGLRDSARVEIVSGLSPGQQVVSAGHQKLFDGAKVMPIPAGMMMGGGMGRSGGAGPGGGPGGAGPGGGAAGGKAGAGNGGAGADSGHAGTAATGTRP